MLRTETKAVLVGVVIMLLALLVDRLFFQGSNWVIVMLAVIPLGVGGWVEWTQRRSRRQP